MVGMDGPRRSFMRVLNHCLKTQTSSVVDALECSNCKTRYHHSWNDDHCLLDLIFLTEAYLYAADAQLATSETSSTASYASSAVQKCSRTRSPKSSSLLTDQFLHTKSQRAFIAWKTNGNCIKSDIVQMWINH